MAITFDWAAHRIKITSPTVAVTVQELVDAIALAQVTDVGMAGMLIAQYSGKQTLGSGVQVGITLELINNWQIEWWAGNYTATIGGGNLVGGIGGDPVAFVTGGPQVEITLSAAATITSGSGVDPWSVDLPGAYSGSDAGAILSQVQTLITELHKIHGLSSGNPLTVTPTSREAGGVTQTITGDGTTSTVVTRT